jgi:hypothetical protein
MATGAIRLGGTDELQIEPALFVASAMAGAAVAGFLALGLAPRWPATALFTMMAATSYVAISVFLISRFTGDPEVRPGPGELAMIAAAALFAVTMLPVFGPGVFAFVVAGSVAWVVAARLALTGSVRVPRVRREVLVDLLAAAVLLALVWGPTVALVIMILTRPSAPGD